jgi:hypothetical protein
VDERTVTARDGELHGVGAGSEQQRAVASTRAVGEPDLPPPRIDRDHGILEVELDLLRGVELGRSQRHPFLGRGPGEVVLREVGPVDRGIWLGADHRHRP